MAEQEKEILKEQSTAETTEEEKTSEEAVGTEDAEGTEAEEAEVTESVTEETEVPDDETADSDGTKTWAEKRVAKKHAKQDKKEDAYKQQIAQLEDKVKRQLAEFENFRNRSEKEKQAMFEVGAKSVIEKILPVIDNFERGFATVDPEDENDAFVDGMQRVYKQMMTELDSIGVKPIEAVGKEFDPNLHNAVMQVESEEYESGMIAQELQKGYTYRDSVVRHSMVSVVI